MAEVDILEPSDLPRIWSAEEKVALLVEIDAEGGKVRLVARRRGVLGPHRHVADGKRPVCAV